VDRRRRTTKATVERVSTQEDSTLSLWFVAACTLVAAAFHVFSQSQRHLWADEASTYWTVQARVVDLLRGARTDGTPPLYFLVVSAVTRLFGATEIVLRLTSILAATALVPASYAVARSFASRRAAVLAAALAAISPLAHYYAVEARPYALLQLETLAILYFAYRAIQAPRTHRWWVLLCVAHAIQLCTHNYALFLLPVPACVGLLVAGRGRWTVATRAAAAALVAFAIDLPWFLRAQASAAAGVADWLRPYWQITPPSAAVARSLEVFGFGGRFPDYLTYLGIAPDVRLLALSLTVGVLAMATVVPWTTRTEADTGRSTTLLIFLLVPLTGAWLYSSLFQPIYYVGRYDTMVLPVFLILFAIGLDETMRLRLWLGGALVLMVVVLAGVSSWPAFGPSLDSDVEDVMAASILVQQASPADPIVVTGTRRPVLEYYLDRSGHTATLVSFPPEIADHPGWYSDSRMEREPSRLVHEGEALAEHLATAARQGHAVWILSSGSDHRIDNYLYVPLMRHLVVDEAHSTKDWRLYCLKPSY
jgi:4-amino-4-deoxy-L-arabinose transferase-like glycosyltransferase